MTGGRSLLLIGFVGLLGFLAGFRVGGGTYTPTQDALYERLLGRFVEALEREGVDLNVSATDCHMFTGNDRDASLPAGGCTHAAEGRTYSFSVQFTETGSIEYSDLEVQDDI